MFLGILVIVHDMAHGLTNHHTWMQIFINARLDNLVETWAESKIELKPIVILLTFSGSSMLRLVKPRKLWKKNGVLDQEFFCAICSKDEDISEAQEVSSLSTKSKVAPSKKNKSELKRYLLKKLTWNENMRNPLKGKLSP